MPADPRGFMKFSRLVPPRRPVGRRLEDWREVYEPLDSGAVVEQARRCMDCGIPFCHGGCPLGNIIPEWNELFGSDRRRAASQRLLATNNFPEFTGRLCPAPCESACVLGINRDPVAIELIEKTIAESGFENGWDQPLPPTVLTGYRVAIVGSGPAGLAAAQQLTRSGHAVTVFERADRPGGLLRYGIPEFKLEKWVLDRRLAQMEEEGTTFVVGAEIGRDATLEELRGRFDAVVLALGSTIPRDLPVAGRGSEGIHFAMDYLPDANRAVFGPPPEGMVTAENRRVVILGGGDTGADCLGTALRQEAACVLQLELLPQPPLERPSSQPWPTYPMLFRTSSAHEEGGERRYARLTVGFEADGTGRVRALKTVGVDMEGGRPAPVPGTEEEIEADLVLLAMGFVGPELDRIDPARQLERTPAGTIAVDSHWQTGIPGVFAAGDARRGQSLIVWAIAEGRSVARAVDSYLSKETELPAPIDPSTKPLTVG